MIVQTSVKTIVHWGYDCIHSWVEGLAGKSGVPVALHLDHCKDLDVIRRCIDSGWTSVMIDASSLPFEENLDLSSRVAAMAQPHGVSVEAELGAIVGVEDDIKVDEDAGLMADPALAGRFCREVPLDCFAPAIGTAHGLYKGEPKLDFERLESIAALTPVPLALHGGTGLADEVFRKCISMGCAKVNISTQLKHTFIDSFVNDHAENPSRYNPLATLEAQNRALKNAVAGYLKLFGSEGKADGRK